MQVRSSSTLADSIQSVCTACSTRTRVSRPKFSRIPPLKRRTWQLSSAAAETAPSSQEESEVFIRRRPPDGRSTQPCGEFAFGTTQSDENKPRNILEEIVWYKAYEIENMKFKIPVEKMLYQMRAAPASRDFIGALRAAQERTKRPGLIAEVKKASPSKGVIQPNFDPVKIAKAYEEGGAACISVLTDSKYFQGDFSYLRDIRAAGVACPLLCKEFVVEAYQMFAARAAGADAILLIAAVLPNSDLAYLLKSAAKVNLQALVEVHTVSEMERVLKLDLSNAMLGINNRNLETFQVDIRNNKTIMESEAGKAALARGLLVAGESGIFTPEDVAFVQSTGCGAILVGESLVKEGDPAAAVRKLLS